ncbi:hypothetical protein BXZ70DRAFT_77560 [Cristinia sonorae]|uniref:Uncharacterized protein n=1 Tax=Cristinia sonorae TaxID=1940300 RepID=A0A8K0UST2_9AGAR|nr:hypothetical protein BXZ70DRAFT_77560 [Cristinia sonorae]
MKTTIRCSVCNKTITEAGYTLHCRESKKHRKAQQAREMVTAGLSAVPRSSATTSRPDISADPKTLQSDAQASRAAPGSQSVLFPLPARKSQALLATSNTTASSVHAKDTVCFICEEKFMNFNALQSHRVSAHPMIFCQLCRRHILLSELSDHICSSIRSHICRACQAVLGNSLLLKQHVINHHSELHCSRCDDTFDTTEQLATHYLESPAHPSCLTCYLGFHNSSRLEEHIAAQHPQPPLSNPSFQCSLCAIIFPSDSELQTHFRDDGVPDHKTCIKCDVGFEDVFALNVHNSISHPAALVTCTVCRRYIPVDDMEEHFRLSSNHPTCSLCDEGFESSLTFHEHAWSEHPELCCSLCGLAFVSPELIAQHFRDSSQHPKCVDCETGFQDTRQLREHQAAVHCIGRPSREANHGSARGEGDSLTSYPSSSHSVSVIEQTSITPQERATMSRASFAPLVSQAASSDDEWETVSTSRRSDMSGSEETPLDNLPSSASGSDRFSSAPQLATESLPRESSLYPDAFAPPEISAPSPEPALSELPLDMCSPSRPYARLMVSYWDCGPSNGSLIGSGTPSAQSRERSLSSGQEQVQTIVSESVPRKDNLLPAESSFTDDSPLALSIPTQNPRWNCRACSKTPINPTATLCGHIFCHECIINALKENLQCPVCRQDFLVRLHV